MSIVAKGKLTTDRPAQNVYRSKNILRMSVIREALQEVAKTYGNGRLNNGNGKK